MIVFFMFSMLHSGLGQTQVDILIVGGGTGGTAAGIQAARSGVQVQIIEATPWLGGMLTAAGVSAIDGNHELPSGIWGEFRQKLRDHYGGARALATGWVSHTLFEPSVGQSILREMADLENLDLIFNAQFQSVKKEGEHWKVSYKKDGKTRKVHNVIFAPTLEVVERINQQLDKIGNITSDGRPILGLDCKRLLEIVLDGRVEYEPLVQPKLLGVDVSGLHREVEPQESLGAERLTRDRCDPSFL